MSASERETAGWIRKLERQRKKVAATRDSLGDVLDELEALKENCVEAYDLIGAAIDSLSELA